LIHAYWNLIRTQKPHDPQGFSVSLCELWKTWNVIHPCFASFPIFLICTDEFSKKGHDFKELIINNLI